MTSKDCSFKVIREYQILPMVKNQCCPKTRALFPLAPCKSILNTFVYEIYQRVFILFELSVKHTLSDFLLPFRCHTIMATIWLNQLVENKFKIILFSNNESLFVKPFFIIFTPINKVVYIFF